MTLVEQTAAARVALERLAPLFRHPDGLFPLRLRDAMERPDPDLAAFAEEARRCALAELQCMYTATFDLAPACSPYLGIHLFGDESRDRARLMVGLRMAYRREGSGDEAELPDHIAEVLRFATRFAADEWDELTRLVLVPALTKMDELLRDSVNPYRHVVAAALRVSGGPS
jgi:nitrate reductase delta subunit